MNFADFLKKEREKRGFTLRGLADKAGIAPSYLSDVEKKKRNAPTDEVLKRISTALSLSDEERETLFDLAAKGKNTISEDIVSYVNENKEVRVALRKAKELNLKNSEWLKIIEAMEKEEKR